MPADYLHNHRQFADLIRIVAQERGIDPAESRRSFYDWLANEKIRIDGITKVGINIGKNSFPLPTASCLEYSAFLHPEASRVVLRPIRPCAG